LAGVPTVESLQFPAAELKITEQEVDSAQPAMGPHQGRLQLQGRPVVADRFIKKVPVAVRYRQIVVFFSQFQVNGSFIRVQAQRLMIVVYPLVGTAGGRPGHFSEVPGQVKGTLQAESLAVAQEK
jgi:hypothetical protein